MPTAQLISLATLNAADDALAFVIQSVCLVCVRQGWIPQAIVNEAVTGVLLECIRNLRQHVMSTV